ncbi:AlpA family phage regulatory protein [Endozoicomonas montiporae]|uniref:helix-turn-helix transcriptional regulator n=1 Tax=Endozoicomonas montiporae TaxID=1027273 RepID=UPI0009E23028
MHLDELKETIGVSRSTIYRWIKNGSFPAPYHLSTGTVAWKHCEIIDWQNDLKKN